MLGFIRHGGRIAWALIGSVTLMMVGTGFLLANTIEVRYQRDVSRMVFNDNVDALDDARRAAGVATDSLQTVMSSSPDVAPGDRPYIVVSIEDHRLWYKQGDSVLFTTHVATGSGKVLEQNGGKQAWRFETPRGRLVVQAKEQDPVWVPPDWHFFEMARKRGLGTIRLNRNQFIPSPDGSKIIVAGNDIAKEFPDGSVMPIEASEGKEITVNGNIVIPPYGTNQRKYHGVLGTFRLNLGDGYGLHGTNEPQSIGHSVSHGCVRLRNEDIETLYNIVPLGTTVYIY